MKRVIAFAVTFFCLLACAPSQYQRDRQSLQGYLDQNVRPGMTYQQVVDTLGEPQARKTVHRYLEADEVWYYGRGEHYINVYFGNGRVVRAYADF